MLKNIIGITLATLEAHHLIMVVVTMIQTANLSLKVAELNDTKTFCSSVIQNTKSRTIY